MHRAHEAALMHAHLAVAFISRHPGALTWVLRHVIGAASLFSNSCEACAPRQVLHLLEAVLSSVIALMALEAQRAASVLAELRSRATAAITRVRARACARSLFHQAGSVLC